MNRKPKCSSVSDVMSRIRSADTRPELVARHWLWSHGIRYRKNVKSLPGSPDILIPGARVAIFINGCFWHQHPGCPDASHPKSNSAFWHDKFARNIRRDDRVRTELRNLGWRTMVIWECQLKPDVVERTMSSALDLILEARAELARIRHKSPTPRVVAYDFDEPDVSSLLYAAEETI